MGRRLALLIATYQYHDAGLRQLTTPAHDAESFAAVLQNPDIAGFEITTLINEPHHRVGEAIGDFYHNRHRDDLTLLYFTGHGLKDDEGRLYLAMANTRRDRLLFTSLSAEQIDHAMSGCPSQQQVLILDCCYSGAFPIGRIAKADTAVHTLERFRGRGRTVLTASDATQYSFEGNQLHGEAAQSVFTRHLVAGLRDGSADLDGDGDITLDELYSYVYERVVEEMPQQRPKKQDNVEGRIIIARNINWSLPTYLRNSLDSPVATDRLSALDGLSRLYRNGNEVVRDRVRDEIRHLTEDDSRMVSSAAEKWLTSIFTQPIQQMSNVSRRAAEKVSEPSARRVTDHPAWQAVSSVPNAASVESPEPPYPTTKPSIQSDVELKPPPSALPSTTIGREPPEEPHWLSRVSLRLNSSIATIRKRIHASINRNLTFMITLAFLAVAILLAAIVTAITNTNGEKSAVTPTQAPEPTTIPSAPPTANDGVTQISDIAGPACSQLPASGEGSATSMVDDPVATAVSNNPLLGTLIAAVSAAELVDTLNGAEAITVFAPINSAFEALPPGTVEQLTTAPNVAEPNSDLATILTTHVIGTRYDADDLASEKTVTSLQGAQLTIGGTAPNLTVTSPSITANVLCANVPTANATLFLIDKILLPTAS